MGYMSDETQQQQRTSWSELVQTGGRGLIGSTVALDSDGKMDESTTATAPTLTTGGVGDAHVDEDDTTTIRSFDSSTGRGLMNLTEDFDDHTFDAGSTNAPISLLGTLNATETCSVSTAPTDEASSLGGFVDWTHPSMQHHHHHQQVRRQQPPSPHRRVPSWEASPHSQHSPAAHHQLQHSNTASPAALHLPPTYSPQGWGHQPQQQQVASFRPAVDTSYSHHQQHQQRAAAQHPGTPPRYKVDHNLPFLPRPGQLDGARGHPNNANPNYHSHLRPSNPAGYPFHLQRRQYGPTNATPPRPGPRQAAPAPTPRPAPATGGARSSSEVLKTLLRKKACLYESDTSRAVALVTWLVGRSLALAHGFFSRQQLQAGVHACVAPTMDAGLITRTKVNRCMQIILNSCFHYIIPRPDGTEESGERMRALFALEMQDDADLLASLPHPWNQVTVDNELMVRLSMGDVEHHKFETPQSSPKIGSVQAKDSPGGKESVDGSDSKRAVLLCFNENVRSAEDVFRCHNEFIRDTAHACNLQLSSSEWRQFFGHDAASTPRLWGNIGIPIPSPEGQRETNVDALGMMTSDEVASFRTTWCSKRYDHDHELCGFAHPEINGGWLRRNLSKHAYEGQMCPHVTTTTVDYGDGPRKLVVNRCPQGIDCSLCHSVEEITYHPLHYKQRVCGSIQRHGPCTLGELCPDFHPIESYRFPRKSDGRSPRRGAHHHHGHQHQSPATSNKNPGGNAPASSPILYVGSAPLSRFEQHLHMPGLQSLFRQNSAAIQSIVCGKSTQTPTYSVFDRKDPFPGDSASAGSVIRPANSYQKGKQ